MPGPAIRLASDHNGGKNITVNETCNHGPVKYGSHSVVSNLKRGKSKSIIQAPFQRSPMQHRTHCLLIIVVVPSVT